MGNEMHFSEFQNGHLPSIDCWCEPHVEWFFNNKGQKFAMVHHTDYTPFDHDVVLKVRNYQPGWIEKVLSESGRDKS